MSEDENKKENGSAEIPSPDEKPKQKEKNPNQVEPCIFRVGKKEDDLFDVRVCRRMWVSEHDRSKQLSRRKRKIKGIQQAQKIKRKFIDELAMESIRLSERDCKWKEAHQVYYDYLDKRYKNHINMSYSTMDTIIKTLDKHTALWDDKWISNLTAHIIETHITGKEVRESMESHSSVQNLLKYIRGVFRRQIELGNLKHNPAMGVILRGKKQRNPPEVMSNDEVAKLVDYAKKINSPWEIVYRVAYLTGARSGELYALKWSDVDFANKQIGIRHSYCWKSEKEKDTKGRKYRVVPLHKELEICLKELKLKSTDPVYVLPRIQEWKNGKSAQIIREFQKHLGIKQSKFHALRGSFITNLLLTRTPAIKVMHMAGHDDLKTTLWYVSVLGEDLRNATDGLTLEQKVIGIDDHKKKKSGEE